MATRTPPAPGIAKRGTRGHIAYLLAQAHGAVRLALDAELAAAGLTTPQFLVLNLLDAYPGASGADLARVAQLTPQTVNLVVRRLERDGLLARSSHETHGRVLRMDLTTAGDRRLAQGKRLAGSVENRLLALLDPATEKKVRRWLIDATLDMMRARPNCR